MAIEHSSPSLCACGAVRHCRATRCLACEKRRRLAANLTCEHCAVGFHRPKDKGHYPRFCSYTCRGAYTRARTAERRIERREARRRRICRVCHHTFVSAVGKYSTLCSRACRQREERDRIKARRQRTRQPPRPRACRACGTMFTPVGKGRVRLCSSPCKRQTAKRRKRIEKGVRRARTRGSAAERIDPIAVFERDRWRCQLCGCSTPKRLRGQMVDRAPELDHIVPLGSGGAHTWVNVHCACRKCNGQKHANPLGQLRLS